MIITLLGDFGLEGFIAQDILLKAPRARLSLHDETAIVEQFRKKLQKEDAPESRLRSRYSREYRERFDIKASQVKREQLIKALGRANVVYLGDYHNIFEPKRFLVMLARQILNSGRRIVIGLESVCEEEQEALDAYLQGELNDSEFKQEVKLYRQENGVWFAYDKPIYDFAIRNEIRIVGTDHKGVKFYDRDIRTADLIFRELCRTPKAVFFDFSGDLHIAKTHLPQDVKTLAGERNVRDLIIYQNFTDLFWQFPRTRTITRLGVSNEYHVTTLDPLSKFVARYLYNESCEDFEGETGIEAEQFAARKDYVAVAQKLRNAVAFALTSDPKRV